MLARVFSRLALGALIGFSILSGGFQPAAAQEKAVVVFAAASLKNALEDIAVQWKAETGRETRIAFASSSKLARQIEQGAPADVFFSADLDWMDYLDQRNLLKVDTRTNLLSNSLVLIAPKDSAAALTIAPGFDLAGALGGNKLAMANVESVPAGKYGKAALEKLGVWTQVAPKVAQTDDVRAALLLVSRDETPFGIVYKTDAAADPKVRIVGTFPADSHPPIIYPVAVIASSTNPDAATFAAYLRSAKVRPLFDRQGFTVRD